MKTQDSVRASEKNVYLVESRSGGPSLKVKLYDGSEKTLHSLYDPQKEAERLVDAFGFDGKGILVVLGLGVGYHLIELVRRFPDADVVVVEGLPEIYELARASRMMDGIHDKIKFIVGLHPDEAIREVTRYQLKKGIPPLALFSLPSEVYIFPSYYQPIIERFRTSIKLKLWERLRYPKFKEERVRVALIDFGYFLTREVKRAIESPGHRVLNIHIRKGEKGGEVISRLIKAITGFKPDFIVTINHLGFDEDGALTSFFESIKMPVAVWYVDSPDLIIKTYKKNVSPYTSIFLWDKGYIGDVKSLGFEDVHYLPLGTDEEVFRPIAPSDKRLKDYRCEVGFVGNSMVEPVGRYLSRVKRGLHPLVDRLAEGIYSYSGHSLSIAIGGLSEEERAMIEGLSQKERMDFEGAILWKATLKYRLSCIHGVKGFDVRVYGDRGWKGLLDDGFRIGSTLNYYRELPIFYNTCKINFNATSLQMREAVNQRVFDVPACGSFLLTDHQKSIEELFEVGKEVITYKDKKEIPEIVRYYLNHPDERKAVAGRGMERVLKEHTYKQRFNKLIYIMRARYGLL